MNATLHSMLRPFGLDVIRGCNTMRHVATTMPDIIMFTGFIPTSQKKAIIGTQVKITGCNIYNNVNYIDANLGTSGIRGVAIYVKNNLKCDEVKLNSNFDDNVWVEISLRSKDILLCGCIYRSPTKEKAHIAESTMKICKVISEAAHNDKTPTF